MATTEENRTLRQRRRLEGLCPYCTRPPVSAGATYCQDCLDRTRQAQRRRRLRCRDQVFTHYGGCCACCGEAEWLFLSIDHVNGRAGQKERRDLYKEIIDAGYPTDLRLLCMNCNWGRRYTVDGLCPHEGGRPIQPAPPRLTNKEKTHCPRGHTYTEENTLRKTGGGRRCRTCNNERFRQLRKRKAAASAP